jgi:hypothetical protein
MGRKILACNILLAKPELRPLERPRHRWENNIEMDFAEREGVWTGFI